MLVSDLPFVENTKWVDKTNMTQGFYIHASYSLSIISVDIYFQTEEPSLSLWKSALRVWDREERWDYK